MLRVALTLALLLVGSLAGVALEPVPDQRDPDLALERAVARALQLLEVPECRAYFESLPDFDDEREVPVRKAYHLRVTRAGTIIGQNYCYRNDDGTYDSTVYVLVDYLLNQSVDRGALLVLHELAHSSMCSIEPWDVEKQALIRLKKRWLEHKAEGAEKACAPDEPEPDPEPGAD